jgi:methylmalonyl-CoA mutase N-terminal domain/subunit
MDEVLALPSDKAARIALRTQQMLAFETGVANTPDPLGGSYFVEALTDEIERQAEGYFRRIEEHGGVIPAIEAGYPQKEIADASFRYQQELAENRRVIVGVNAFQGGSQDDELEILRISPNLEVEQVERVRSVRAKRDQIRVGKALNELRKVAQTPAENTMPFVLEAVRAYATEGEIMGVLSDVFGVYTERAII